MRLGQCKQLISGIVYWFFMEGGCPSTTNHIAQTLISLVSAVHNAGQASLDSGTRILFPQLKKPCLRNDHYIVQIWWKSVPDFDFSSIAAKEALLIFPGIVLYQSHRLSQWLFELPNYLGKEMTYAHLWAVHGSQHTVQAML